MIQKGITVIIPAKNEERTISKVLNVLTKSVLVDEIIVVNDGSSDDTKKLVKSFKEVKIVNNKKSLGKGKALKQGVERSTNENLLFLDADLVGLTNKHIELLTKSVLRKECQMCVGVRNRYNGLPMIFIYLSPILAIGGERCLKKEIFEQLPEKIIKGFSIESYLNHYCKCNNIKVNYRILKNLDVVTKEKKQGLAKGLLDRLKMCYQLSKVWFKIILLRDKVFSKKNSTKVDL